MCVMLCMFSMCPACIVAKPLHFLRKVVLLAGVENSLELVTQRLACITFPGCVVKE